MSNLDELIDRWGESLCKDISVGGLLARCPIAHKWKSPFRSLVVREALLWRMHDLGQQILCLRPGKHVLGQRILLRSAVETLAILIYMNYKTRALIDGSISIDDFDEVTRNLLMGSKDGNTEIEAVNILTVLKHAEKTYQGLTAMHERLSESTHPNYDGVLYGYSTTNPAEFETHFSNRWYKNYWREQEPAEDYVYGIFEREYNTVSHQNLLDLEHWLRDNDARLEANGAAG